MSDAKHTPGPWRVCQHLKSLADDAACPCGYRGVIFGPGKGAMAVCQPGHDPAPAGQEGTEPGRYPREVEIANARRIVAAVNACEGVPVEALEAGVVGDLRLVVGLLLWRFPDLGELIGGRSAADADGLIAAARAAIAKIKAAGGEP